MLANTRLFPELGALKSGNFPTQDELRHRQIFHHEWIVMTEVSALTVKTPLHNIFTGRNEVVAKVIFLHLFVILFTGGVSVSVHTGIPHPPGSRHPLEQTPPRSRHSPPEQTPPRADTSREQTPPGADTPPPEQTHTSPTHPWSRHTPLPGKQTRAYGLWATGTHPTRMHSCLISLYFF